MAERLNKCPKCGATQYTDIIVKAHDPNTMDMNMKATLRCGGRAPDVIWKGKVFPAHDVEGCGHVWEGLVTSPIYTRLRDQGQII